MILPLPLASPQEALVRPETTLWADRPADRFVEGYVLGNGRLGATVLGGVGRERVVLNESTLWSGSPQDADRPDARQALPQIRELLLKGDNAEAESLVNRNFVCKGGGSGSGAYGCYQTLGDLTIDSPEREFADYRRTLDLDRAVTTISYRSGGVGYLREAFASAPAGVLVYRYRADRKASITFDARLSRAERATVHAEGGDFVIEGELASGQAGVSGVRYAGRLRVLVKGGRATVDARGVHVVGADEATLLFSAGTSMFDPAFGAHVRERVDRAARAGFDRLRGDAERDHQRYFRRVALRLPEGPSAHRPRTILRSRRSTSTSGGIC